MDYILYYQHNIILSGKRTTLCSGLLEILGKMHILIPTLEDIPVYPTSQMDINNWSTIWEVGYTGMSNIRLDWLLKRHYEPFDILYM